MNYIVRLGLTKFFKDICVHEWFMYEEKKKRFFPPLTHLYLTQTRPPFTLRSPFTEQFHFPIQNPRLISTLPALSFVNVFILKRNLTLCTYPPCGIRVGWGFVGGCPGVGGVGGLGIIPSPSPPLPPFYFNYRRLVTFLLFHSRTLR